MENITPQTPQPVTSPQEQPTTTPQTPKSKMPLLVGGIVALIVLLSAGTYFLTAKENSETPLVTQTTHEATQAPEQSMNDNTEVTTEPMPLPSITITKPTKNTSVLPNIKYTLPEGWTKNINDQSLVLIGPSTSSGYISIEAYDYSETIGRREFYCAATNQACTASTTFKESPVGNIQGYNALNLNIGGPQFFGAKGSVFYTIFVFNAPAEDKFEEEHKQILNSLIF